MLEELAVPYDTCLVEYGNVMKEPEYLAINPMGKVPALVHGDQLVTETAAICAYLAEAFPQAGLKAEPAYLGAYYRWLFFAAGPLEAATADHLLDVTVPEPLQEAVGYGYYDLVVSVLESHLKRNEYAAGPHFSAADVYLGSIVYFNIVTDTLERRPAFESYVKRVTNRPAFDRVSELDGKIRSAFPN